MKVTGDEAAEDQELLIALNKVRARFHMRCIYIILKAIFEVIENIPTIPLAGNLFGGGGRLVEEGRWKCKGSRSL